MAPDSSWEILAEGYVYTDSPAADAAGNVYFAEVIYNKIFRVSADGQLDVIDEDTAMTMGLAMGADGSLYGCRNREAQIVRYDQSNEREVLFQGELTPLPDKPKQPGEFCNDLAVNAQGGVWFTDRVNRRVMYLSPARELSVVAEGFRPNGIVLSADGTMIAVTDSVEPMLHAFKDGKGGALERVPDFFDPIMTVQRCGVIGCRYYSWQHLPSHAAAWP